MRRVPLERLWVRNLAGSSSITSSGVRTYNLSGLICGLTTKPKLPHYSNHLWAKFGSKLLHTLHWHVCVRKHYDFHSTHISLTNKHFIFHFAQNLVVSLQAGELCQRLHPVFVLSSYGKTLCFVFFTVSLFVCLCHWERQKGWDAERKTVHANPWEFRKYCDFYNDSVVMEKSACNIPRGIDECRKYPTPWMHLSKMQ